jgi:hypothetical protein
MAKARYLYETLVAEGIIKKLRKKKYIIADLNDDFKAALDRTGLGFPRWCNARIPSLPPVETSFALTTAMVPGDEVSWFAHRALCADYPYLYQQIYGTVIIEEISAFPDVVGPSPRLTFTQRPENRVYVCETLEYGKEFFGSGRTPEEALNKLKSELGIKRAIQKLERLQDLKPIHTFRRLQGLESIED